MRHRRRMRRRHGHARGGWFGQSKRHAAAARKGHRR